MIKTGILGTNDTAKLYVTTIKEFEGFELTGCYSPDYNTSKSFASAFGLIAYPSIEALFNYCDALIITDFSPGFLSISEKSLKNFKHILITNPFLAELDEIRYLRKLSEESRVMMQIAGGFVYHTFTHKVKNESSYFSDLKHTFSKGINICSSIKFMEILFNDVSFTLTALKGAYKKVNTAAWDIQGNNLDLMCTRLELDNGCIGNIMVSRVEDENKLVLSLYTNAGVHKFELDPLGHEMESMRLGSVMLELSHFASTILNRSASCHNDVIFQSFELVHSIKAKVFRYFTTNIQE